MTVPVGVTNQIDTIITTTMKLLEEKGYTDTDRWSEETFDQDYRPVIHEMIEKIYKLGKEEGRNNAGGNCEFGRECGGCESCESLLPLPPID